MVRHLPALALLFAALDASSTTATSMSTVVSTQPPSAHTTPNPTSEPPTGLRRKRLWLRLTGAFMGTSILIPVVTSLITAALFIVTSTPPSTIWGMSPGLFATAGGVLLALLIWAVMTAISFPYTSAKNADAYSFNLLQNRRLRLKTWEKSINTANKEKDSSELGFIDDEISQNELKSYISVAEKSLDFEEGFVWVSTIGYVNISRLLHRAEEALIMIESLPAVIADESRVEVAIINSAIGNKEYHLQTLQGAREYLSLDRIQMPRGSTNTHLNSPTTSNSVAMQVPVDKNLAARTAIRAVTNSLNEFQDDQWEKLVYVRNQLNRMIVLTGLVLYVLLEFAIVASFPSTYLIGATLFFLIGAGVGLFSRLYEQSRVESSIGNVRLAGARLNAALLFSGLAAIGGVVVMQQIAAPSGSPSFDLNLFNILISAAFGLTPNLFFSAIQKQVEEVDKNMASQKSAVIPLGGDRNSGGQ